MRMEQWSPVQDFPNYSVSNLGRLRREHTGRIIPPQVNQRGALYVPMWRDGQQYQRALGLLIARAFVPPLNKEFDHIIQLDGDRTNCQAENLMWRPRWFAIQYNRQWREHHPYRITDPIVDLATELVYDGTGGVAITFGLLEKDILLSILNRTYAWPTYQQFGLLT